MKWLIGLYWIVAIYCLLKWRACWRLAGGCTWPRFWRMCRRNITSYHGLTFGAAIAVLATTPFFFAFELGVPALTAMNLPLALIAISSISAQVSFLVLAPSSRRSADIVGLLNGSFLLLRAGSAVDPIKIGDVGDTEMGAFANLWFAQNRLPWQETVAKMIEAAPIIVFDGRAISEATLEELIHLLLSPVLPRVIVVGPVTERAGVGFLFGMFKGLPTVDVQALPDALHAPSRSREALCQWYRRNQTAIVNALSRLNTDECISAVLAGVEAQTQQEIVDYMQKGQTIPSPSMGGLRAFLGSLPDLIRVHCALGIGTQIFAPPLNRLYLVPDGVVAPYPAGEFATRLEVLNGRRIFLGHSENMGVNGIQVAVARETLENHGVVLVSEGASADAVAWVQRTGSAPSFGIVVDRPPLDNYVVVLGYHITTECGADDLVNTIITAVSEHFLQSGNQPPRTGLSAAAHGVNLTIIRAVQASDWRKARRGMLELESLLPRLASSVEPGAPKFLVAAWNDASETYWQTRFPEALSLRETAHAAIREIGTAAIPWLCRALNHPSPAIGQQCEELLLHLRSTEGVDRHGS